MLTLNRLWLKRMRLPVTSNERRLGNTHQNHNGRSNSTFRNRCTHTDEITRTGIVTAEFFVRAKHCGKTCSSTGDWLDQMWNIQARECWEGIKTNEVILGTVIQKDLQHTLQKEKKGSCLTILPIYIHWHKKSILPISICP